MFIFVAFCLMGIVSTRFSYPKHWMVIVSVPAGTPLMRKLPVSSVMAHRPLPLSSTEANSTAFPVSASLTRPPRAYFCACALPFSSSHVSSRMGKVFIALQRYEEASEKQNDNLFFFLISRVKVFLGESLKNPVCRRNRPDFI